ncbi:MAG: hypothetical protein DRI61_06935 [Chloroflexi bacterium]|nr:MAG: hypothetical protein DRI61_06935 [Chloroflexota bacterium]
MKKKIITLFVYGTLKSNGLNNSWLNSEGVFVDKGWVHGELYVDFLPYLFEGKDKIKGEVYKVPLNVYKAIENMEVNAGYYAKNVKVHLAKKNVTAKVFYHTGLYVDFKRARRTTEY